MDTPNKFEKSYKRAIIAREHHYKNFNYWMNFYAIIIGALFVGYYTIDDDLLLKMIVALMGFAASFAWFQSFRGYYHWIKQWMNVVMFYEEKYLQEENTQNGNIDMENMKVYSMYYESDDDENSCCLIKSRNISTQKITLRFIFILVIAWLILLIYNIISSVNCSNGIREYFCSCICSYLILIGVLLILGIITFLFCCGTESDVSKHTKLKGHIGNYTITHQR